MKKKKVIIASLALTFSLSVGTAFASVDAGGKLQQWYDGRFQQWEDETVEYSLYHLGDIRTLAQELKSHFELGFMELAKNTIITFSKNIEDHNSKYLSDIQSKNTELKRSIETDFDDFVTEKNKAVNEHIESEVAEALREISSKLNSQGQKSVDDVSLNVGSTARKAEDELGGVINSSKGSIESQMGIKEENSIKDAKKNLDEMITARKGQVQQYTSTYSDEMIGDIQKVSDRIQKEAETDMVNIISNINK